MTNSDKGFDEDNTSNMHDLEGKILEEKRRKKEDRFC